jgi:hypothetical protein
VEGHPDLPWPTDEPNEGAAGDDVPSHGEPGAADKPRDGATRTAGSARPG